MKTSLDIDLTRQIFRPGEEIHGKVYLHTDRKPKIRELIVSLQGEEMLGANSIARSIIRPIINEKVVFLKNRDGMEKFEGNGATGMETASFPITFKIPEDASPSYASDTLQCSYFIKGRLDLADAFDVIEKMRITIVPYTQDDAPPHPVNILLEEENLKINVELEKDVLLAGETLSGSLQMEHIPQKAPTQVNFELRAQERSTEEKFQFKRTLWNLTKEVPLKDLDIDTGYTLAKFEFPIPLDVPFSHKWRSFEVRWSFRVSVSTYDGRELKIEKPLQLKRII